jgi:hypothetical protein
MDDTTQFVCDHNVARFVQRLRSEHNPDTRASVRRLLVEEEDKFGRSAERLVKLQHYITEGIQRIASQEALIRKLRANGQDIGLAEITLGNLVEIQTLFEQYHKRAQPS